MGPSSGDPRAPAWLVRAAAISWRLLIVAAAVVAVAYVLVQLRLVVLPLITALFATALLSRPNRLLRRRLHPGLAAAAVLLSALVVVGAIGTAVAPSIADQVGQLDDQVRAGVEEVTDYLAEGPLDLSQAQIDRAVDRAEEELRRDSGAITRGVVSGAVFAVEIIAGLLLALVLTFFFLKDGERLWGGITALFRGRTRRDMDEIGRRGWETLSSYLGGLAIVATADTTLITLILLIVGVPLVVPLALLTFFASFIPIVGAFIAGLVATLVALVSGGPVDALIVLAGIVVVQQIDGNLLNPIVVGRALRLHPVTILLSVTTGGVLAGVAGAFIAVPIAAVTSTTAAYLRERDVTAPG